MRSLTGGSRRTLTLLCIMCVVTLWFDDTVRGVAVVLHRHEAQVELNSQQPFRLVFRISGSGVTCGIDYVTVSNDTCQPFSM